MLLISDLYLTNTEISQAPGLNAYMLFPWQLHKHFPHNTQPSLFFTSHYFFFLLSGERLIYSPREKKSMIFLISGIWRVGGTVLFMEKQFPPTLLLSDRRLGGRIKGVLVLGKVWVQVEMNNPSKEKGTYIRNPQKVGQSDHMQLQLLHVCGVSWRLFYGRVIFHSYSFGSLWKNSFAAFLVW